MKKVWLGGFPLLCFRAMPSLKWRAYWKGPQQWNEESLPSLTSFFGVSPFLGSVTWRVTWFSEVIVWMKLLVKYDDSPRFRHLASLIPKSTDCDKSFKKIEILIKLSWCLKKIPHDSTLEQCLKQPTQRIPVWAAFWIFHRWEWWEWHESCGAGKVQ